MKQLHTPDGDLIVGIVETTIAVAGVAGFSGDLLDPVYDGNNEVIWDSQEPYLHPKDGRVIYKDNSGQEWSIDQLTTKKKMSKELTQQQIDRQDFVDNAIFALVNDLVPDKYRRVTESEPVDDFVEMTSISENEDALEWDIGWITEIREVVHDLIGDKLGIIDNYTPPSPEKAQAAADFETAFYPHIELD